MAAQAYAERVPDASLTLLYRKLETGQDTADVGIELPLPFFDRRTGRIQETAADARRAHAHLAGKENDLIGQLRRAYESLVIYYRQAETFAEIAIAPGTEFAHDAARRFGRGNL